MTEADTRVLQLSDCLCRLQQALFFEEQNAFNDAFSKNSTSLPCNLPLHSAPARDRASKMILGPSLTMISDAVLHPLSCLHHVGQYQSILSLIMEFSMVPMESCLKRRIANHQYHTHENYAAIERISEILKSGLHLSKD